MLFESLGQFQTFFWSNLPIFWIVLGENHISGHNRRKIEKSEKIGRLEKSKLKSQGANGNRSAK